MVSFEGSASPSSTGVSRAAASETRSLLDRGEARDVVLGPGIEQRLDPPRAVGRGPVVRQVMGIVDSHHPVVGGDDAARRRVVVPRQRIEGHTVHPVVLPGPARHRHMPLARGADRHVARRHVADVAVRVGEGRWSAAARRGRSAPRRSSPSPPPQWRSPTPGRSYRRPPARSKRTRARGPPPGIPRYPPARRRPPARGASRAP